jgi:2-oxoglutarate dehydrogenase E2 component (dihydrolipoamide succinyltransferase)
MKVEITVPGVGESITSGLLASWSVADGKPVIEGQALFELETDKTTIDVTSPATGILSINVPQGTEVTINQVVGTVDTEAVSDTAVTESAAPAAAPPPPGAGVRVTPAAKAAAAAAGVNPAEVRGTGRGGMVTRSDVLELADKKTDGEAGRPAEPPLPPEPAPHPEPPPPPGLAKSRETVHPQESAPQSAASTSAAGAGSGGSRKPLSRIRKIIAANLTRTRNELVLLTTFNEADMSAVKEIRTRFGPEFLNKYGVKLGFMSFFLKASASALTAYPELNARIDGDDVLYPDGIHISVAVSTPKGLVTPVVRHVETKSFAAIETEIAGFSRKAEEKTLMPEELTGGTFTVTNGGIFGSMMSTPLPAPGQSAVLGMHAIIDRPAAVNGQVVIRPMMYLALSYDHRLVDGREAVGCLKMIKDALENPERLLLGV